MAKFFSASRLPGLVAVGLVLFAFWPALVGGGALVPGDVVRDYAAPFEHYQIADDLQDGGGAANALERSARMRTSRGLWPRVPTDTINIHSHWASLAAEARSGDVGWWNSDLAGGQPTMKAGLPIFNVLYLVVPAWFAPGLVAAVRALTAIGLTYGFARSLGLLRVAALVGGLAFGFSGFMVGWMNWPHSSVAALGPGLLWAVERLIRDPKPWRAVPLALVVSAMVWANFPQMTILVLLAALVYVAIRLPAELRAHRAESSEADELLYSSRMDSMDEPRKPTKTAKIRGILLAGFGAVVLTGLFAAPHVIGFAEFLDWADTTYRDWGDVDSAAGAEYLITAVAPALWGHVSLGPVGWLGEVNWIELNAYVGASVLVLAVIGIVFAYANGDRRDRGVVAALAIFCVLGILVGYIGGPLTAPLRILGGDLVGSMARAKVFWHLGVALAAAFGVDHLVRETGAASRWSLRKGLAVSAALLFALLVAYTPFASVWLDTVSSHNSLRSVLAASVTPALCVLALAVVLTARLANKLPPNTVGWLIAAIVGYELLSFAMPLIATVERDERITATPAHGALSELLEPGERLGGEGWTFFPSTTALFDIDDARGQVSKSPGYNALYRVEDPNSLVSGHQRADPTWPYVSFDADIKSPVWDAMAVGVWAQFPDSQPPGTVVEPVAAINGADPARTPLNTVLSSPEGGLRAVLLEVVAYVGAEIRVELSAEGQRTLERRYVLRQESPVQSFAFLGEDLPAGTPVFVEVTSTAPLGKLLVGVDESAALVAGMVAGDDDLRLARAGDVLLIERPSAAFVRLADTVLVEPDPLKAAQAVASRESGERTVVVDKELGLRVAPSDDAQLSVVGVSVGRDRVETQVRADRDAVVVISVANYPGWSATVDGEEVEVVTADAAFIGVPVAAGEHIVTISFVPRRLRLGILLAMGGVVLSVLLVVMAVRERQQ